jgi:hypothetical protein
VSAHPVQWVTASPLWPDVLRADPGAPATRDRMRKPALLRFASDDFMDDLDTLLGDDPARLADLEAGEESLRPPPPGEDPATWRPALDRMKLYQAAHGRFYLVAATLACRIPGLPEHPADPARREQVAFVLRRLHEGSEWAWAGPGGSPRAWAEVDAGAEEAVADGEDLLPLFPVNYEQDERRRRLYVGLVPTSSRESFAAAGELSPLRPETPPPGETSDPRALTLERVVLGPMRDMPHGPNADSPLTGQARTDAATAAAATRKELSQFALLELAGLLRGSIPALFAAVAGSGPRPGGDAGTLYDAFAANRVGPAGHPTWLQALRTAWEQRLGISGEGPAEGVTLQADLSASTLSAGDLDRLFVAAMPPLASPEGAAGAAAALGPPTPPQVPKLDARGEAVYALRCVYRRPHCGPLQP